MQVYSLLSSWSYADCQGTLLIDVGRVPDGEAGEQSIPSTLRQANDINLQPPYHRIFVLTSPKAEIDVDDSPSAGNEAHWLIED